MNTPTEEFDASKLYEFDPAGKKYILNISAKTFKDLFNKWDYSPYKKRDINEALIKYIEDCAEEVPLKHKVAIHLFITNDKEDQKQVRETTIALKLYFQYLVFKKISERKKYRKNASFYGLSGLVLLFLASVFQKIGVAKYFLFIVPEGLYIGGWVLFWEVCSILFFKNREISQKIREYTRLTEAEIFYHFEKEPPVPFQLK
jgi:hypothetical protein